MDNTLLRQKHKRAHTHARVHAHAHKHTPMWPYTTTDPCGNTKNVTRCHWAAAGLFAPQLPHKASGGPTGAGADAARSPAFLSTPTRAAAATAALQRRGAEAPSNYSRAWF